MLETTHQKCGAKSRRSGDPCQHQAGWGTDHVGFGNCKMHGGASPGGRKKGAALEALAMSRVMGLPITVEPIQALLNVIYITAGEVEYTTMRIALLSEDEAVVTYHEESEDGYKSTNQASLHIWIQARRDAMDRLARYAKMAIDAGVAERQVRVAEHLGGLIGRMMSAVLDELELTPAQAARAPEIVQRQLAVAAAS